MSEKKRVLFVCATGIATSTAVEEKVIQYCKDHGVTFEADQTNVGSVPTKAEGFDLVVATTNVPYKLEIPVIRAIPLLTGIGEEQTLNQILEALK